MPRGSSAGCWAADGPREERELRLDFRRPRHDIPAATSHHSSRFSRKRTSMTDSDLHDNDPASPAQASEPVVSKPYIMPDDPEVGSVEALAKEAAESRDKMLRT